MPQFLRAIADRWEKNTQPLNRYEGFKQDGAVILRDRRGTAKAEIPNVSEKANGGTLSDDPLAIYKPTGAKAVDAAKATGNFTGWNYTRPINSSDVVGRGVVLNGWRPILP